MSDAERKIDAMQTSDAWVKRREQQHKARTHTQAHTHAHTHTHNSQTRINNYDFPSGANSVNIRKTVL